MTCRPIFILGNRRSGTTMLRLMLAAHPNIGIPPEGGFIVTMGWSWLSKKIGRRDYPRLVEEFFFEDNAQDWEFSPDQLRKAIEARSPKSFPEFIDEVYCEYIRHMFPGKTRWGDKTTWYLDFLPMILRAFPNAQFLHIIRDGRAVVASFKNVEHLTGNVVEASLEWDWSLNKIRRFGGNLPLDQYHEVHYENLVNDSENELKHICDFFDEDYSPKMLSFYELNREKRLEPERHLGWKKFTLNPVTSDRIEAWRNNITNEDLLKFWTIGGETMKAFGYESFFSDLPLAYILDLKKQKSLYFLSRHAKILARSIWHRKKKIVGL